METAAWSPGRFGWLDVADGTDLPLVAVVELLAGVGAPGLCVCREGSQGGRGVLVMGLGCVCREGRQGCWGVLVMGLGGGLEPSPCRGGAPCAGHCMGLKCLPVVTGLLGPAEQAWLSWQLWSLVYTHPVVPLLSQYRRNTLDSPVSRWL